LAGRVDKLVSAFAESFIEPLFSFDLDKDGKPDIQQIKNIVIFKKFPIGIFILELLKGLAAICILWMCIQLILKNTKYI